jgi:alpha-galactosidase
MSLDRLPWKLAEAAPSLSLEVEGKNVDPAGYVTAQEYDARTGRLTATLANPASRVIRPTRIAWEFALGLPAADGWFWVQGRAMHEDTLVREFGTPLPGDYGDYVRTEKGRGKARRYTSHEVAVLVAPVRATPALLAGSLRGDRFPCELTLRTLGDDATLDRLCVAFDLTGLELSPGEACDLPPLLVLEGRDPLALIERYAGEVGVLMGARVPANVPAGWCSWYTFSNRVTEADVLANLGAIAEAGLPLDVVQVDDGWQAATGDWTPNEKFPDGMSALAARIREAGRTPGLWLAPFVLREDSRALAENGEMVLHRPGGDAAMVDTWLGRCAILDCTHPAAADWLTALVRTAVSDWGYGYLKLDALAFAAQPADRVRYHAPGTTGLANVRRGLEVIRAAAGDDTFILGCTCPFAPAIGLVDAMRVGPDVNTTWAAGRGPSVRQALRMTLQRNWMHKRLWLNDPDCLVLRDTGTQLSGAEVRFLATGVALSGGLVVSGDDLPHVGATGLALTRALLPGTGVAAKPMDPGEGPVPSAWRAELGPERSLVGILDWKDEPAWVQREEFLEPGEVAFDVWNGRLLGMGDSLLRPHEGAAWQVSKPAAGPRVVGDSASLTFAGLLERRVSGRVQVRNDLDWPRVVALEVRGQLFEVTLAPGEARWFD